jgi:hypothetical protein
MEAMIVIRTCERKVILSGNWGITMRTCVFLDREWTGVGGDAENLDIWYRPGPGFAKGEGEQLGNDLGIRE